MQGKMRPRVHYFETLAL